MHSKWGSALGHVTWPKKPLRHYVTEFFVRASKSPTPRSSWGQGGSPDWGNLGLSSTVNIYVITCRGSKLVRHHHCCRVLEEKRYQNSDFARERQQESKCHVTDFFYFF